MSSVVEEGILRFARQVCPLLTGGDYDLGAFVFLYPRAASTAM
jgi:hypothetical protein